MSSIAWACIVVAGLLEPCWVISMERSERFRRIPWTIATCVLLFLSLFFLSLAMQELGPGTSYAIWTGIGAIGTLIAGIVLFKEPVTWLRILFILMIVVGIVGINLTATGGLLCEF
ncbi:MAG: multidrug efflux SMR transporter [Candidatus Methanomethylophilaceae archaeon]